MALTNAGRATAIFNQIAAGPNFDKLSEDESEALKASIETIWGTGDLTYLKASAEILPGTFQDTAGAPVATTGSAAAQTGTVTAPSPLTGKGVLS